MSTRGIKPSSSGIEAWRHTAEPPMSLLLRYINISGGVCQVADVEQTGGEDSGRAARRETGAFEDSRKRHDPKPNLRPRPSPNPDPDPDPDTLTLTLIP